MSLLAEATCVRIAYGVLSAVVVGGVAGWAIWGGKRYQPPDMPGDAGPGEPAPNLLGASPPKKEEAGAPGGTKIDKGQAEGGQS